MSDVLQAGRSRAYPLPRREVAKALLAGRGEALVVAGLGATNWDISAVGDRADNFPLWGAMGGAAMLGLGLALAQPGRRVLVLTGDGDLLMGLGSLATIATQRPDNLALVAIDNESYAETGMQATATAGVVDLPGIARAAGFATVDSAVDEAGLARVLPLVHGGAGPVFIAIKVRLESLPLVMPPKDGAYLKDRFRLALLGPGAVAA
ncbi:MAG: aldehyde dehydrogenase [Alphaproteobacteria bacterium]|nr:aldehyde dehydrogenase [Alphaproteobacteria bacterium]